MTLLETSMPDSNVHQLMWKKLLIGESNGLAYGPANIVYNGIFPKGFNNVRLDMLHIVTNYLYLSSRISRSVYTELRQAVRLRNPLRDSRGDE